MRHGPFFCFLHGYDAQFFPQRDEVFVWASVVVPGLALLRSGWAFLLFSHLYLSPQHLLGLIPHDL